MSEPLTTTRRTAVGQFTVTRLAFGCWRLVDMSTSEAAARINACLDADITLIDTADVYGLDWGGSGFGAAEELLGQVLAADATIRDRIVLASKGGIIPGVPYDSSEEYLRQAVEASLRRLQTETIDLYQIHRPDLYTHPADLAGTLTALREEGKIREIGVSNVTPAQSRALAAHLDVPLASTQPQFSAAHLDPLQDGTLDLAMELDMAVLAWSPLHGGALVSGDDVRPELVGVLDRLAERESCSRADIAHAWILAHPSGAMPILGTQNVDRIAAAPDVFDITLTRPDVYDIIEASQGAPLP
ncbi:aldo/keto reductase [Euzebya tangerina]|uniref:aldo/keto reductase n=1 Tax=Euzebya tangerina TaxID=591198 RepID=UPI000E30C29E|nr:aldo/keto reductase [Euzebya tangerina]